MDKTAIKNYAIWARVNLIEAAKQRAYQYEITKDNITDAGADVVSGKPLTKEEKEQRRQLIDQINRKGFDQVMEEVAYTWFNRFIALRFMEVNGYLPTKIRVFTDSEGNFKPEILREALTVELPVDKSRVMELLEKQDNEELYKMLLIAQCNELNKVLPGMFQRIEDYTELLLPNNLLHDGSVVERLISDIAEDDFNVASGSGQIEIIGWMYQYYISEVHDKVVDPLHGKTVEKNDVPAATQLFTTDWVVRYLIDNSVGKYWIEHNPNSALADELTYYVRYAENTEKSIDKRISPQEITVFDPCVGSGHFLIYAFDVLMKIYLEFGYSERDAALEIITNNIFGLDIDGRAAQLAYFSVMMKARQYDRRFFSRGIQPNVSEIIESNNVDRISVQFFCNGDAVLERDIDALIDALYDSKEYGSAIQIPNVDFERINDRFSQLENEISLYNTYLLGDFKALIRSAELLSKKYTVVSTNPPYLNKYDAKLKDFINEKYPDFKGDLFSVFIYRNLLFCKEQGYSGLMTPMVWMFIQTYSKLREYVITKKTIDSLVQLEYSAFEEATVPLCFFVIKNALPKGKGTYVKLSEFVGGMEIQRQKFLEAINTDCDYLYTADQRNFMQIPAMPLAYWVSPQGLAAFSEKKIIDYAETKTGMQTCDNNRFLRLWYEVNLIKTALHNANSDVTHCGIKWVPYNKGGDFRKWYGNQEYVLNWENDGQEAKEYAISLYKCVTRTIKNIPYFYRRTISWSKISSGKIAMRYYPDGFIFDVAGCCMYSEKVSLYDLLALMNSTVARYFLSMLSPTINFEAGHINAIPIKNGVASETTEDVTKENIALAKSDWDSYETSWDFKNHPLI